MFFGLEFLELKVLTRFWGFKVFRVFWGLLGFSCFSV